MRLTTRPSHRRGGHESWYQQWSTVLSNHQAFVAGAMSALSSHQHGSWYWGLLNSREWERFQLHHPSYVIRSYETPIAWWSQSHGWYVVEQRFSVTTSRHQTIIRSTLARMADQPSHGQDVVS